jgi:hypothetical protein
MAESKPSEPHVPVFQVPDWEVITHPPQRPSRTSRILSDVHRVIVPQPIFKPDRPSRSDTSGPSSTTSLPAIDDEKAINMTTSFEDPLPKPSVLDGVMPNTRTYCGLSRKRFLTYSLPVVAVMILVLILGLGLGLGI